MHLKVNCFRQFYTEINFRISKTLRLCLKLRLRNFFEKKFLNNLQKTLKRDCLYSRFVSDIPDAPLGHPPAADRFR